MAENDQVNWEERYKQLEGQYRGDMERVYNMVTATNQQQQPPQEEPLWDTSDPGKLKEQVEGALRKTVSDTLTPVVATLAGNQFESNMSILRGDPRFPYFQQWEGEIRQMASQVAPGLLSRLDTIANIYSLVATRHHGELIEHEVQRRMSAQADNNPDEVEVDDDEEETEEEEKPQRPVPPPQQLRPPQPQRQASSPMTTQTSRSVRSGVRTRLTREEAYMAERMGMTLKEYAAAKNLGDVEI